MILWGSTSGTMGNEGWAPCRGQKANLHFKDLLQGINKETTTTTTTRVGWMDGWVDSQSVDGGGQKKEPLILWDRRRLLGSALT